jgi:DNA-directed RNA polymerase subunit M/transcription elongation factor TFIIS
MESVVQEVICPNCGKRLRGIVDEHGGCKLHCRNCGVDIYSKRKNPHTYVLEVKQQDTTKYIR